MAVYSDGSYGIKEGLIYSFPVTIKGGKYTIVKDLAISDFSRYATHCRSVELINEHLILTEYFLKELVEAY